MERFYSRPLCAGAVAVALWLATAAPAAAAPSKLPPEFKLCMRDENIAPCLEDAIVGALQILANGLPDFGIPPMDPLKIPQLEIGDPTKGAPVNLHISLSDISIHNLKGARPIKSKFNLDHYEMSTHGILGKIYGEANYVMDGRILVLPAKGEGKVMFNITNLEADMGIKGEKNIKKSKEYMKVVKFDCEFTHIEKLEMDFENLFNGDTTLGPTINNLINENWQDIWSQLKLPLEEIFRYTFHQYSRRIFDKVPMDDIFLKPRTR